MNSNRKPRKCQTCAHTTTDLTLQTVSLPTEDLRHTARNAGLPETVAMWLCAGTTPETSAMACLHRLIERHTDRTARGLGIRF